LPVAYRYVNLIQVTGTAIAEQDRSIIQNAEVGNRNCNAYSEGEPMTSHALGGLALALAASGGWTSWLPF